MHIRYFPVFFFLVASTAQAATPKEKLMGSWEFKRGIGGSCASLILKLRYVFHRDGRYEGNTTVKTGSKTSSFEYSGTYEATNDSVITHVNGYNLGPNKYRIKGDILTVVHHQYNCEIELEREDY